MIEKWFQLIFNQIMIKNRCFFWIGSVDGLGYPRAQWNKTQTLIRALTWEVFRGRKNHGRITTTCGHKTCLRPSHLISESWMDFDK